MKITGRKQSAAYELYGFIPRVENGKHSAICMACNRILQNTAALRLQRHRNACVATRAVMGHSVQIPNLEVKKHVTAKQEEVYEEKSLNLNIKMEQSNSDFDDTNNDNANNNTSYEDDVESSNLSRRLHKKTQNDEMNNIYSTSRGSNEPCNSLYHEKNTMHSPIPGQPPDHFESYHTGTNTSSTLTVDIDEQIKKANDEGLFNIKEELNVIQNIMPRSKEAKQMQNELFKAETEYYRCKAAYFTKLTENCSVKRTLMLLESRKLQLEIEKLRKEL